MLITKRELLLNKKLSLSSKEEITNQDLDQVEGFISLKHCLVNVEVNYVDGMDLAICSLSVKGEMNIKSTRSLKPTTLKFKEEDTITYSFTHNPDLEDDSIIEVLNNEFDLHQEFVSLIITSIPIKIISKDEPESFSGDTWEVISEDQYEARKKTNSSPFDVLKDLDLD